MKTVWKKNVAWWVTSGTLYLSVPFTWQLLFAQRAALAHDGPVIAGGPAVDLLGCDGWAEHGREAPEGIEPVTLHNPEATFTTRGCIRRCEFCAVPKTEGPFRELRSWVPRRIICDNQFLAASLPHVRRAVRLLRGIEGVDFNQGLDARLFTDWHAEQLSLLKKPKVRFAFDHVGMEPVVASAIERARSHELRDVSVYVLIGFRDNPEDALHRLETVRARGAVPNPIRYQPLDARRKNAHVAPGWTEDMLHDVMRYYSRLTWLGHVTFAEYQEHEVKRRALRAIRRPHRIWRP